MKQHGISIDRWPMTNRSHAQRVFERAKGHIHWVTTDSGANGFWMVYDAKKGIWTRHDEQKVVGEHASNLVAVFTSWIATATTKLGELTLNTKMDSAKKAEEVLTLNGLIEELRSALKRLDGSVPRS